MKNSTNCEISISFIFEWISNFNFLQFEISGRLDIPNTSDELDNQDKLSRPDDSNGLGPDEPADPDNP